MIGLPPQTRVKGVGRQQQQRHKEHSGKNNEERRREKHETDIIYIYAKLSGIDLIERFSLYSHQNKIFGCKIKMRQGNVYNNNNYYNNNNIHYLYSAL